MTPQRDINTALLDYLGVDHASNDVLGVTLRMRAGRYPTLIVHRQLIKEVPRNTKLERFELRPIEAGPE